MPSMPHDFDQVFDRRRTRNIKWTFYGDDVLPMWVADMDFAAPPPILAALHARVDMGDFGYELPSRALGECICERMHRLYQWDITPDQIVYIPSLVTGLNAVCRAIGDPGDGVLVQTPVYPPFLTAPTNQGRVVQMAELTLVPGDRTFAYRVDYERMAAVTTSRTRLFILCNPHNPTGEAYSREELLRMAAFCEEHDLIICSDEIHCDLLLGETRHIPIATLAPEIADRTITMMAPSKTYNIPGLKASFAIVTNPDLRKRLMTAMDGIVPWLNSFALAAMEAAYRDCDDWLHALLIYLTANRDYVTQFVIEHMPQIRTTTPHATYLAWFDCREAGIAGNPYEFFRREAQVALNDGTPFGAGGEGFVRLNFGCPRALLMEGLERMRSALERAGQRQ
ncbi:MalY/PatB family protein [Roseiflexus sp.]|uniref:MalY/PatB family protein n=1 Tax=Roseiflexus sp. TaxID=2562120 RepID=UPI00398AD3ED